MARLKALPQEQEEGQEPVTAERFKAALADDFAKHGLEVIEQMREKTPAAYAILALQVIGTSPAGHHEGARDFMLMSAGHR